jgi:hypothetical protein
VLVALAPAAAIPAWSADSPSAAAPAVSTGRNARPAAANARIDGPTANRTANSRPLRAAMKGLSQAQDAFKRAAKAFPAFCKDWGAKLRKRERDNLTHITWKTKNGAEVGTYTGYGSVKTCECKQSSKGIPVGKLSYQEFEYELDGKTVEEAKHAPPKTDSVTDTTELIGYDKKKKKWFY